MPILTDRARAAARRPRLTPWPRAFGLLAAATLLGVAHLFLTVGPGVLRADNPIWHPPWGDTAQSVLGAEALQDDPHWHVRLGVTDRLLSGGKPVSIVYTDSAPWISILAKAAGFRGAGLSAIGLVAVLSVVLQPLAFAALLLALGVRRAESVLAGAAIGAMLPAWYVRTVWHVALSSHWVMVLALAAAAVAIRRGVSRPVIASLAGLGALSIGLHAYLFAMVAAVAMGALLADVARVGRRALPRALGGIAAFLACSAVSAWLLGYGGGSDGGGGFGEFSMNLLSPILPQHSSLRAALTGDPGSFVDATGGQYEGFNYLGAGALLLIVAAALAIARRPVPWRSGRAALPLGAALLVLVLLAVSDKVFLGSVCLVDLRLPLKLDWWLGQVRSSGRLFWPVAYLGLALAVLALDRLTSRPRAAMGLAAALALQVADTRFVREELVIGYAPRPRAETVAWDKPFAGQDLRFLPSFFCASVSNYDLIRGMALAAERAGGRVEGGPLARFNVEVCGRETMDTAFPGTEPGRIDLVLPESVPPGTLALAARSGRCADYAGAFACGSAAVQAVRAGILPPAPAPALPAFVPGQAVLFTAAGTGKDLFGPGWSPPLSTNAWTSGERAILVLPLPPGWTGGATFVMDVTAFGVSPLRRQEVTALVEGRAVEQWQLPFGQFERVTLRIPASAIVEGMVAVEFVVPHPLLLNAAGRFKRKAHGFGLRSVTLLPQDQSSGLTGRVPGRT